MRSWINVVLLAFLASTCGTTSTAPSQTRFTLSGTVRDSAALQPLAGVHVMLVEGAVTRGVDTNAQGRFAIPDLLAGTFEVQFSKDGYNSAQRTVSLTADVVLDVTLDEALPPRYTLSGVVRTPWNELLREVGVEAVADGRVRGGSTTTSSGAYNMPGLAPTDYVVRVRKWGYYANDVAVHLTGDTRLDFTMDLLKRALGGRVEESPPCVAQRIRGATVRVLDGPDAGTSANTSLAGEYKFDELRWGTIKLQASRSGYVTTEMTVDLGFGNNPTDVNFRLTPLSGTCGTTP
jgi:Carboxypeptidase regulatory-like domain